MTDDGDQVTMSTRLDPENAKAILGIVEGHALDQAGKDLMLGRCGLPAHRRLS